MSNTMNITTYNGISIGNRCRCQHGKIGTVTRITLRTDYRKANPANSVRVTYIGKTDEGKKWQSVNPVKI